MVVAGGSGGHVFPAIGFCQELKTLRGDGVDIIFVTMAGPKIVGSIPKEFKPVELKVSKSPWGVLKLIFSGFSLILKTGPDAVFGFGGYICVPFIILARLLGKRTIIHEQNVVPGKANKFLSAFADKIAVSFPGSEKYFGHQKKKIFLSRYPLRQSLKPVDRQEAFGFFGFQEGYFTILVAGGSQGAHRINENFLAALKENKNLYRFQIIHLTGSADLSMAEGVYQTLPARSKVFDFLPQMHYAYSIADLVIGRSGAGSVSEIMRFGLPSILIPYPYAGGHQVENAKFLAQRGASILLEDGKMTPALINGLLDIFVDDTIRRKTMAALATSLREATQNLKLSDLVLP